MSENKPTKALSLNDLKSAVKATAEIEKTRAKQELRSPQKDFVIIGRGALVAWAASPKLRNTEDFDIVVKSWETRGDIEKSLGAESDHRENSGYYVQGVDDFSVMKLPSKWQERTKPIKIDKDTTAYLLAPYDIAAAKLKLGLASKRPKDIDHVKEMLDEKLVEPSDLVEIVSNTNEAHIRKSRAKNLGLVIAKLSDEASEKSYKLIEEAHKNNQLTKEDVDLIKEKSNITDQSLSEQFKAEYHQRGGGSKAEQKNQDRGR